jgi:hypothetical protein
VLVSARPETSDEPAEKLSAAVGQVLAPPVGSLAHA